MNNYEIIQKSIQSYNHYATLYTPFVIEVYASPNENIWWFVLGDDEDEYNNNFYGDKDRYEFFMFTHKKDEAIDYIKEWLNGYEECTIDILDNRLWQLIMDSIDKIMKGIKVEG